MSDVPSIETRAARWAIACTLLVHVSMISLLVVLTMRSDRTEETSSQAPRVTLDFTQVELTAARDGVADRRKQRKGFFKKIPAEIGSIGDARVTQLEAGGEAGPENEVLTRLRKLIEREKYYPATARRAGYTGTVVVMISIAPGGTIAGYEIVEREGDILLEQAVAKTMDRVAGKALGTTLHEELRVRLPIRFELD